MNKVVTLSALAALSSALYFSPVAQACDGHDGQGKGGPLTRMDSNADGKVTQQEMLATLTARFDAADTNKDGKVTPQEREASHESKMKERLSALDTNKNGSIEKSEARGPISRFFAEIDSDKNGALSTSELAAHRENHGKGHARMEGDDEDEPTTKADLSAKVSERFKRLDNNGDGVLSEDELARGHHGGRGHHGEGHKDG